MEYTKSLLDSNAVRAVLALTLLYACIRIALIPPYRPKITPQVANLPGPPPVPWIGWLLGNMMDVENHRDTVMHPSWIEMGWTGRVQHICAQDTIWTFDPAAIGHVFQHSDVWERTDNSDRILKRITGTGLLTTKGADHRRQRRIVNPAFSTNSIKEMVPVMFDKADQLSALMGRCVDDESLQSFASRYPPKPEDRVPGARKIDMLHLSTKLTQDVIGKVGFNTDFESLEPKENVLDSSINRMLNLIFDDGVTIMMQNMFALLDYLPTRNRRAISQCRGIMERLTKRLIREKSKEIATEAEHGEEDTATDMVSLLVRAGSNPEREDQRMTDEEVRSQMATLLFAGSTTTAGTICCILHQLAIHHDIQRRLREEIEAVGDDHPSFETLNSLPLLDNVVREILRLEPPVTCTVRASTQDDVLPLSVPVRGRDGTLIEKGLPVGKGTYIFLSISSLQRRPEIWGEDAEEFNPDRFLDPTIPKMNIPGMWGGLASFINGPHHCIGWRLALTEIKVVIYTLLRGYSFDLLPSKPEIFHVMNVASRPEVVGEVGGQMPLLVRRIETAA